MLLRLSEFLMLNSCKSRLFKFTGKLYNISFGFATKAFSKKTSLPNSICDNVEHTTQMHHPLWLLACNNPNLPAITNMHLPAVTLSFTKK